MNAAENVAVDAKLISDAWQKILTDNGKDPSGNDEPARFTDGGMTYAAQSKASDLLKQSWMEDAGSPLAQSQVQQEALSAAIEAVKNLLPMERNCLVCLNESLTLAHSIRSSADTTEHDAIHERVKDQALLVGQLGQSLKAATTELNAIIKKKKAAVKAQEQQKRSEALKAESQKAEAEQRKLRRQAMLDPFRLDFAVADFQVKLRCFDSDDAFCDVEPATYELPFKLKTSALVAKAKASPALTATLTAWVKSFPETKIALKSGRVIAPLDANRGGDDAGLAALLKLLAPSMISSGFPRFEASQKCFLCGNFQ